MQQTIILFVILTFIVYLQAQNNDEDFTEELHINTLENNFVSAFFQFKNQLKLNIFADEFRPHYNLFPKSLGEIISRFKIAEFHLTFTQGRWRYNKWNYPKVLQAAPTGVELWVWFHPTLNQTQVDKNWFGLVNALSGQFCSSLNFIKESTTVKPKNSFKPLGLWTDSIDPEIHLRYAVLSRETMCTENLSPWKKLLPCPGNVGLASLLNPFRLFDSSYHSLGIHLKSVCNTENCSESVKLELKQTLVSVFNPMQHSLRHGWSISQLFQKNLLLNCPLASSSKLYVDLSNLVNESLSRSPDETWNGNVAVFNLKKIEHGDLFELSVKFKQSDTVPSHPYITAHKHVKGFGGESIGSVCKIYNHHTSMSFDISYMDVLPYFVRTFLHTLRVHINRSRIHPEMDFVPAYYRQRPALLSLRFRLPPNSTARISIDFEKVFLEWTQHPPDAHHGYYIGPSVIDFMVPQNISQRANQFESFPSDSSTRRSDGDKYVRLYTEAILIPVALPDFSMPYNVICLTCTVVAIAFGSIYNATTRTFQVEDEQEKKGLKEKIVNFVKNFLSKTK